MRPFTRGQPKVMLPVGNRPFLEYLVRALARNGVRDLIMVVGYHRERIMSHFKDGSQWGVSIQYVNQEKQLGTAHAFHAAENHLKSEESFILMAGDNLIEEEDILALVDSPEPEALLITQSHLSTKYGVVQLKNERVSSIQEQDVSEHEGQIFTGICRFTPAIFDFLFDDLYLLTNLIQERLKHSSMYAITARTWMDAVYPQDLLRLNHRVLDDVPTGYGGIVESGVIFKEQVNVAEGSILRANTYLKGPIILGEGVDIGPSSAVFGPVSIGENSVIGPFCEIRNSLIMDNVIIGMGAKLHNAIIGSGTVIGSRFTTQRNRIEGTRLDGVAVGQDCSIEDNVTVANGITIGNAVRIDSGKQVNRSIDDTTIVI